MTYMYSLLLPLMFLFPADAVSLPPEEGKLPIIELTGSPYERGFKHGSTLKTEIQEVYFKWKKSIKKETGKDADAVIADFIGTSNYKQAILKWSPEIWEEIKGIAAGSGQEFNDVLAFQLIDEYWGYLDRLENNSVDKTHCSALGIAASNDNPTMVAQNVDIDTFMHGYQVVFHIPKSDKEPEQYIVSCAGFIGFIGFNSSRIGLTINALTDLNNSIDGLPVTFICRKVLSMDSDTEVIAFLRNVKHATGQNYLLGTKDRVLNLEASANEVVAFYPSDNEKLAYHTNHSIVNHDVKPWMEKYHELILKDSTFRSNSTVRFRTLKELLGQQEHSELNLEEIKNILRSKNDPKFPICVTYDSEKIGFTFSSVIISLGEEPFMELTYGSPDLSDYQRISLNKKL